MFDEVYKKFGVPGREANYTKPWFIDHINKLEELEKKQAKITTPVK